MEYTVKELRSDFVSKLLSLGISPDFTLNPALSSVLAEIDILIGSMGIKDDEDKVKVSQESNLISFTYRDEYDNAYILGINLIDPKNPRNFQCIFIKEEYSKTNAEEPFQQRTTIKKDIELELNNYLNMTTFGAVTDDLHCQLDTCNNKTWSETSQYSSTGIMLTKEEIDYGRTVIDDPLMKVDTYTLLYIPHKDRFASSKESRSLQKSRTIIRRKFLDTASLYKEDKINSTQFSSIVPLNQENGLRDMNVDEIYYNGPKEVFIPPLENWEIDLMITSEANPIIQESLKNLSTGREDFTYDSTKDPTFERKGFEIGLGTK